MKSWFSAQDVQRVTGVARDSLDYWCANGIITASQTVAHRRRFSFLDVITVKTVMRLRAGGVSLQAIKRVASRLRAAHSTSLAGARLIVTGDDVALAPDNETFVSLLLQPGQSAMRLLLDLGAIEEEMVQEVAKLAA